MNDFIKDPARLALGERRDCAVRSIAGATGISYAAVHAALKAAGRPDGRGTYSHQLERGMTLLGLKWRREELPEHARKVRAYSALLNAYVTIGYRNMNSKQLAADRKHMRESTFIVNTANHYTALVNGEYFDHIAKGRARKVRAVWRIELTSKISAC